MRMASLVEMEYTEAKCMQVRARSQPTLERVHPARVRKSRRRKNEDENLARL